LEIESVKRSFLEGSEFLFFLHTDIHSLDAIKNDETSTIGRLIIYKILHYYRYIVSAEGTTLQFMPLFHFLDRIDKGLIL
jgi:hypothetical protein